MIIYMVRNKINNKIYFGQTSQEGGFNKRYKNNFPNKTHNQHIKRAIDKYGWENFEVVKEFDKAKNLDELNALEDMYIKMWDTTNPNKGYNKKSGGNVCVFTEETIEKLKQAKIGQFIGEDNPFHGKTHSDETKQKISNAMKGRFCGTNSPNYGKTYSEETRRKMGSANVGKIHSEETKKKWSEQRQGVKNARARKVVQYSLDGEFIRVWDFMKQAGNELKINPIGITKCCRGASKSAGGFLWAYVDENGNYPQNLKPREDKRDSQGLKIEQYEKDGTLVTTWNSMREASEALKISTGGICACCKGKIKTYKGYIWKYVN